MSTPLTNAEVLELQAKLMVEIETLKAQRNEIFTRVLDVCPKLNTGCGLHLAIYNSKEKVEPDGHNLNQYNNLPIDIRVRYEMGGDSGWVGEWIPYRGKVNYGLCQNCQGQGRDPFPSTAPELEEQIAFTMNSLLASLDDLQRKIMDAKTSYKWLNNGVNPVPYKPCTFFQDGGNTWVGLDAYHDRLLKGELNSSGVHTNDPSAPNPSNPNSPSKTDVAKWWEGIEIWINRSWNLHKPAWIFVIAVILYFVVFRDKNRT